MSSGRVNRGNWNKILAEEPWLTEHIDVAKLTNLRKSRADLDVLEQRAERNRHSGAERLESHWLFRILLLDKHGKLLEELTPASAAQGYPYRYHCGDSVYGDMLAIALLRYEASRSKFDIRHVVTIQEGTMFANRDEQTLVPIYDVHVYNGVAIIITLNKAKGMVDAVARHLGWQPPAPSLPDVLAEVAS